MDTNDPRTVHYLDQIIAATDEGACDLVCMLVAELFEVPSGQEPTSDMWTAVVASNTGDV